MRWTEAQAKTIETRDKNILVSAAAGSGKTTVLIERIKRLVLEDRVDIDRFLITTFTNAAAAEMKEKMEKAIHSEMEQEQDPKTIAFLQRQLQLLPQASISTFHTFALGVMRDFFYLTDLQPGFIIGDETQLQIMRRDSADEVFERRFAEDGDAFRSFLRKYSSDRSDEKLKDQILDLYQKLRSIPGYLAWAKERNEAMGGGDPIAELGIDRFLAEESREALGDAIRWFDAAAAVLDREETGSICLKARQDAEHLRAMQQTAVRASGDADALAELADALGQFKANAMRPSGAEREAFETVKEDITWLRDQGKKCLNNLKKNYFSSDLREAGDVLRSVAEDTGYLIGLIEETELVYRRRKGEQNLVDFDDCMHYAIEILKDEKAAADYRERFRYIFIDEYQDSNMLQEEIIGRIARPNNLFMVGDVKQSIYKFRLAEPEIFRRRYEDYRSGRDGQSVRIDLNHNFRSRRTIRNAVNRIFEGSMDGYDDDAALHGPEQETGPAGDPVRLHILSSAPRTPEDETVSELTEELSEAAVIAGIIRESLGKPLTSRDGTVRPIGYGDIAVLSRGGSAIPQIERFLNNEGIPAYGQTEGGYYETVEIQVFLNFLRIISNPKQDVPLISAMSSVVFDFSPRQLAQIRIECREGSFYDAVRSYEKAGADDRIREKIAQMMEQIAFWKEIARTLPLDELMRRLLYETGYYDYCSGLPTGRQRTSNLRLLLQKAAAYEERSHMGLYGFLSYVEALRQTKQKVSEASLIGEGRDVVRVMTVHKSKGLEFPVVILAGAGKRTTASSSGRSPSMHKGFAIALPQERPELHWWRRTLLQKVIDGKRRREGLEEEIRILYVALTRPIQRLAIVASAKDVSRLQPFPGKSTFLEMIYPAIREMAEESSAAAEIIVHPGTLAFGEAPEPAQDQPLQLPREEERAEEPDKDPVVPIDPAQIDRRLSFAYPYREQQMVKTKYSVTELSGQKDGNLHRIEPKIPALRNLAMPGDKKRLSAAEIGTAMHTCMERIDFPQALEGGVPYIRQAMDDLLARGILTEEEYASVRPENIAAFFAGEPGARAAKAPVLMREREFLLRKEVAGVPTIVQGIIDCCFEDARGLVLIDYKNSWAEDAEAEQALIQRYEGQVRIYAEALQEALGRPVSEAWLYLFKSRRFIAVDILSS